MRPLTIDDLKSMNFFIPAYQRGYRWTEYEVRALLDDVKDFSSEGYKQYCLQPLIVKKRKDGSYEVVDGQQRLTTIYIFLKIAEEKTEYMPYNLEFETRKNSQKFLAELKSKGEVSKENIDYFHITTARKTINTWLDEQHNRFIAVTELFKKFIESVIFIWYEIDEEVDSIEMFTKVNLGKIPLTSSELIKALLLNKENFRNEANEKEVNERQIEISLKWDKIEQGLQVDSFWYFLNQKDSTETRIDFLFELLARKYNDKLEKKISETQNNFSFIVFSKIIDQATNVDGLIKEIWQEVERLFLEFQDWYSDLDKYHIIGYLIASSVSIDGLFTLMHEKRKSEVRRDLIKRVKDTIPNEITLEYLSKMTYGETNPVIIRRILLLFNVATLICKSEKQYRFPFDIYKGESKHKIRWDIEHIHATADGTGEADDSLGNLTLLDRETNRSPKYGNKTFVKKREYVLEREFNGLFVPLCTKNIFLKAYESNLSNMECWDDIDKKGYLNAMVSVFETFFSGGIDE